MIETKWSWYGEDVQKQVHAAAWEGIRRAAQRLTQLFNVPSTVRRLKSAPRTSAGPAAKGPSPIHAAIGNHLAKHTGGQADVKCELDEPNLTAAIGQVKRQGGPRSSFTAILRKYMAEVSAIATSRRLPS